jgi:hypothetical protein
MARFQGGRGLAPVRGVRRPARGTRAADQSRVHAQPPLSFHPGGGRLRELFWLCHTCDDVHVFSGNARQPDIDRPFGLTRISLKPCFPIFDRRTPRARSGMPNAGVGMSDKAAVLCVVCHVRVRDGPQTELPRRDGRCKKLFCAPPPRNAVHKLVQHPLNTSDHGLLSFCD